MQFRTRHALLDGLQAGLDRLSGDFDAGVEAAVVVVEAKSGTLIFRGATSSVCGPLGVVATTSIVTTI